MKRLFRGLRRPPDPHYDVVVIGSGVGGLIAGNLLARDGAKVLLVEQHYMVGGYCSTFRRGGFSFDAATHFYPLLGNPETLSGRLLAELGVETRWVKMDPVDTFHFPDGSRFAVPARFEVYLARLKAEFPDEAAALDRFFGEVREAYLLGLLYFFRGREVPRLVPYLDLTVRQALERHFRDPKLRLLLTADCPHWGSPPGRTSFVFDSMLRLSYFLGNYYPRGGSQAFADELARCFEAHGGHILMSTAARRIVVERGAARGVDLETLRGPLRAADEGTACGGRRRVRCSAVVSNADLLQTWETLVPPEHVPADYLHGLRRLRPTYPCFLTHIGLAGVDAAELEAIQGYYWDSWEMDRVGVDALRFKLFVPTLYEPAVAPPGGQVLIVQKVLEMDYGALDAADAAGATGATTATTATPAYDAAADAAGGAAAPRAWRHHKQAVEDWVLGQLERLLPGIGGRIVVRSSASAQTSWRFTLNHRGAMLGWEMSPEQLGPARPELGGPLDGLYAVGHWTRPGGGITPVIVSAQQVARAVVDGGRWTGADGEASAAAKRSAMAAAGIRR